MSVSFLPGYDFEYNEEVTSEKLRKWIAGTANTATLVAADVGLSDDDTGIGLNTTSTWNSGASMGAITFNKNTGFVEVTTKWGAVPVFGTQGGLFTSRLRDDRQAAGAAFNYLFAGNNPLTVGVESGLTATLPAANYTLGTGYDCFGGNDLIGACAAAGYTLNRGGKTLTRYPNNARHSIAGTYQADSCVSLAASVHSLYKIGGVDTLRYDMVVGGGGYEFERSEVTSLTGYTTTTMFPEIVHYNCSIDFDYSANLGFLYTAGTTPKLAMFKDSATNFTTFCTIDPVTPLYSMGVDEINKILISGNKVYAYTYSTISLFGTALKANAQFGGDGHVGVNEEAKEFLVGDDGNVKSFVLGNYVTDGSGSGVSFVHSINMPSAAYDIYGVIYDKDEDLYVCSSPGYGAGVRFIEGNAATGITNFLTYAFTGSAKYIQKIGLRLYGFVADYFDGHVIYLSSDHSSVSKVSDLLNSGERGSGFSWKENVGISGRHNSHAVNLYHTDGSTVSLSATVAVGNEDLRTVGVGSCIYVTQEYNAANTFIHRYDGLGSTLGAAPSASGSTGVRGEMSGNVWNISVNASGVSHPTPQRIHPNTQCFYETGEDKLSTCLLYPTLSTPSEGFSKGGSNF